MNKTEKLWLSILTPEQKKEWRKDRRVSFIGSHGNRYRVMSGYVRVFCKECNKYDPICMSLDGRFEPTEIHDLMAMISYKTTLEADERIFWNQKFQYAANALVRASGAYSINLTKKRRKS